MQRQSTIREIFDNISMQVIQFLEGHIGITDVEFVERQGVAEASIAKWEEENAPIQLPDDYKAFLQISDGLQLGWKIKKNDQIFTLGTMNLNRLRDIKRIRGETFTFGALGEDSMDESSEEEQDDEIFAFEIDSKCKDGRLALIYQGKDNQSKPQIWFQDLSCKWFFIANTFTDYFRLMIVHLGIPHWQYSFTNTGLDQQTLQWFRFLSPERLAIDMENRRSQEALAKRKYSAGTQSPQISSNRLLQDKLKLDGIKRKKRRMRMKAKDTNNEAIIEKFCAQSCKSAKYAKTSIKKREASEPPKSKADPIASIDNQSNL